LSLNNGAKIIDTPNKNERYKFYDILSGFYKTEVKKPLPDFEFFELLYHKLGSKGLCKFFLIKYQEEIVGGIICPIFKKDSIYEFYIYGKRNIRKIYPSVLSTWAPIEWGARMGYKFFNFMGAGNPYEKYGVREFKERFGGLKLNSGRFLNVHKPILYHSGRFFLKFKKLYKF
jgi:lipid II:glycine glycyltransferase (peptidoglycan interpeptide bridge formation enzyme)